MADRDVSALVTPLKIGGTSGNTEIEVDGTLKFNGAATVWDDVTGSLIARRLDSTAGRLQYDYDESAIIMQDNGDIGNRSDRLIFNFQYPHAAVVGGEMRLHIHWEQKNSDEVEFTTQYRLQKNGQTKEDNWTTAVTNSTDESIYPYVSETLNQITELVDVDMTGAGISCTVQFRVARTDDTGGGDIRATFIDAHVARDTVGSREPYVK